MNDEPTPVPGSDPDLFHATDGSGPYMADTPRGKALALAYADGRLCLSKTSPVRLEVKEAVHGRD